MLDKYLHCAWERLRWLRSFKTPIVGRLSREILLLTIAISDLMAGTEWIVCGAVQLVNRSIFVALNCFLFPTAKANIYFTKLTHFKSLFHSLDLCWAASCSNVAEVLEFRKTCFDVKEVCSIWSWVRRWTRLNLHLINLDRDQSSN